MSHPSQFLPIACRWLFALCLLAPPALAAEKKPYRIPPYGEREFNQGILWGSEATSPDGFTLAFGGQDLDAEDGIGHTRIKEKGGQWKSLLAELRGKNPYLTQHDDLAQLQANHRVAHRALLSAYYSGLPKDQQQAKLDLALPLIDASLDAFQLSIYSMRTVEVDEPTAAALKRSRSFVSLAKEAAAVFEEQGLTPGSLRSCEQVERLRQRAVELFNAEPPPRALSPIVYEPESGLFLVFGGDHFDFLMNDLWSFDPKKRQWSFHMQEKAPPPRAGHTLKAEGGKIIMTGGYAYTSNTDYCGSQYEQLEDGKWVYDTETNEWSGGKEAAKMAASSERVYRTGPFHPDFYLEPAPDREANEKILAAIGPNTWTKLNPPKLPELNRDWGTAIYDPQRDLILRFSGGHSAHGGSDVLHYHLATNRWELCFPVEFPLGQLYSNTSYPEGLNFNGRPWVTGHTYKSYGLDPRTQKMLFVGHQKHTYFYDPAAGDWEPRRQAKPEGMNYGDSYYTLTLWATTDTLYCWTQNGELFKYVEQSKADGETSADKESKEKSRGWVKVELTGDKLAGSVVDHSGMTWDSKRNRLLCCRTPYGDNHKYDGQIYSIELDSGKVTALSPAGAKGMGEVRFLRELVYEPESDLMIVGAMLPGKEGVPRRTPAYDGAKNRWVSLLLDGDHPHGKEGRNVSLGMIYDPQRKLLWAVDTNSQVYALRVAADKADIQPLPQ
jgi:hypothetical protein